MKDDYRGTDFMISDDLVMFCLNHAISSLFTYSAHCKIVYYTSGQRLESRYNGL